MIPGWRPGSWPSHSRIPWPRSSATRSGSCPRSAARVPTWSCRLSAMRTAGAGSRSPPTPTPATRCSAWSTGSGTWSGPGAARRRPRRVAPERQDGEAGMLRGMSRRARASAACCAALAIGAGAAVTGAGPASADEVRNAQMWVLDAINAPTAWQVTKGQGIVVAVIDSGVDPDVSDLTGSGVTGPALTRGKTPSTNAGWGAHGRRGGGSGITCGAPGAEVLSIRVVTDKADPGYGQYQRESDSRVQQSLA